MEYLIKYSYNSSNSMNDSIDNYSDVINISWKDYDKAKQNFHRICEHEKMYEELNSYMCTNEPKAILEKYENKDWFVRQERYVAYKKEEEGYFPIDEKSIKSTLKNGYKVKTIIDQTIAECAIRLYTDDGKPFQTSVSWLGMFEHLTALDIIVKDNDRVSLGDYFEISC